MKIKRAMTPTLHCASPRDSVRDVARLMRRADCGFVPVVEHGRLLGVITDRDLVVRGLASDEPDVDQLHARDVMTTEVVTIDAAASLADAAHLMAERGVRRLLVVEEGELGGVLSYGDLEQALHADGRSAREATLGVTRH